MSYTLPILNTTHSGALHLDVLGNISLALPYGVKASNDGYSKDPTVAASFSGPSDKTETDQNITADEEVYETHDNVTGVQLSSSLITISPVIISGTVSDSPCTVSMRVYMDEKDQHIIIGYGKTVSDEIQWSHKLQLNTGSLTAGIPGWHMITFQYASGMAATPSVFIDGQYAPEAESELEIPQTVSTENGIKTEIGDTDILYLGYPGTLCDFRFYLKCLDFSELYSLYVYSLQEYVSDNTEDADLDWQKSLVSDPEVLGKPGVYASLERGDEYAKGGGFIQYKGGVLAHETIGHKRCCRLNGMGCIVISSSNLPKQNALGTFIIQLYLDPDLVADSGIKYGFSFGFSLNYMSNVLDRPSGYNVCIGVDENKRWALYYNRIGQSTVKSDTYIPAKYRGWLFIAICSDSVTRMYINNTCVNNRGDSLGAYEIQGFPDYVTIGGCWDSNRNVCDYPWIGYAREFYYYNSNYINSNYRNYQGALTAWRSFWTKPEWANPVNTCSTVLFLHKTLEDYAAGNTTPIPLVPYGNPVISGDYISFPESGSYIYIPAYHLPQDVMSFDAESWTLDIVMKIPDKNAVTNDISCIFGNNGYTSEYYAQRDRWCLAYYKDSDALIIEGTYDMSTVPDPPKMLIGEDVLVTVECVVGVSGSTSNIYTIYINGQPKLVNYTGSTVSGSYPSRYGSPRNTANYIGWDGGSSNRFPAGILFKTIRLKPGASHNGEEFSPADLLAYNREPYT